MRVFNNALQVRVDNKRTIPSIAVFENDVKVMELTIIILRNRAILLADSINKDITFLVTLPNKKVTKFEMVKTGLFKTLLFADIPKGVALQGYKIVTQNRQNFKHILQYVYDKETNEASLILPGYDAFIYKYKHKAIGNEVLTTINIGR